MEAMFQSYSKKRGFTLVELVLTIVLVGALAVVGLPRFFDQSAFEERYFHDDLISAARYAQRLAIGSGCSVKLSVSSTGFLLEQDANCSLVSPSYSITVTRPFDSAAFSNTDVPSSLTSFISSHSAYYFLPEGGAVDGSGTEVGRATIALTGVSTRTIYIVGVTGYAYSI